MFWIAIGSMLGVAFVVMMVVLAHRSSEDLGSVSDQWVAEHRADANE